MNMLIRGQQVAEAWKDCSLRTETGCCLPSRPEIVQQAAKIDHPKTASGPESPFSLTRQTQTSRVTTGALSQNFRC
jgi:hypothetical protein